MWIVQCTLYIVQAWRKTNSYIQVVIDEELILKDD